jgi:hypothetical protein
MPNPFDWDYLTTPPASGDVLDAWTIIFLAFFLVGFVFAAYTYYRPWTKPFGRLFRRRAVMKVCNIAMWIFGAGLFFFLIRLLQINPLTFGEPIWLWLCFLAALGLLAWVGYAAIQQEPLPPERYQAGHVRQSAPRTQPARRPVRRDKSHR